MKGKVLIINELENQLILAKNDANIQMESKDKEIKRLTTKNDSFK